jgi:mycoredoxin
MTERTENKIMMYGTDWCPDCILSKHVFKKLGVAYTYVNIDQDPAGEQIVRDQNAGSRSVPTIIFPDNSVLIEPSRKELTEKLISLNSAN